MRIPVEFELPGERPLISREGDRLIFEPVRKSTGLGLTLVTANVSEFSHIEILPVHVRAAAGT